MSDFFQSLNVVNIYVSFLGMLVSISQGNYAWAGIFIGCGGLCGLSYYVKAKKNDSQKA